MQSEHTGSGIVSALSSRVEVQMEYPKHVCLPCRRLRHRWDGNLRSG